jgi:hypothetical protein
MNTPRKMKRYGMDDIPSLRDAGPSGKYSTGLVDDDYAAALGDLTAYWSHIEEAMIFFFELLLGHNPSVASPARQIYRSITAPNARIKVLRAVLEKSEINRTKTAEYDEIISEFDSLNSKRNTYVHGLWETHESGKAFLSAPGSDDFYFYKRREVPIQELQNVVIRIRNLARRINRLRWPEVADATFEPLLDVPDASPEEGQS